MQRPYNIKFNRTLFRRALLGWWISAALWFGISGALSAVCYFLSLRWDWLIVPTCVFLVVALWQVGGTIVVLIPDTLEFRSIHGPVFGPGKPRKRVTKKEKPIRRDERPDDDAENPAVG